MQPPVSEAALAQARRAQVSSMVDTCIIRRREAVPDGAGGSTETVTFVTGLPCRVGVGRLARGEVLVGGQLTGQIPSTITLPAFTDIRLSDRINVNGTLVDTEFVSGTTYEVIAEYFSESYETARSVLCIKRS